MSDAREIAVFGWGLFTGWATAAALAEQWLVAAFFTMIAFGFGCFALRAFTHD